MTLWAIVPVKPLRRGRSRLAGVLTDEERTFINDTMLRNTLIALKGVPEVSQTLVVSRDPGALALARDFNAKTLQEDGSSDSLNAALRRATVVAQIFAASHVLIVPADLPLINANHLKMLVGLANHPPVVVISSDRRKDGTNALLINPAGLIDYQFGPGSFQRHVEQAQKCHVRVEICDQMELGLDLDLPEDLEYLRSIDGLQSFPSFAVFTGGRLLKL